MIQHTINLFLFSELQEGAKKAAIKQAIDTGLFEDTVQLDCDSFIEDLRYYLGKIADIESVNYNVGFCKSDYFRIRFNSIQWVPGAKASLDYAPDFIVDFFNAVQFEFKKLVYLYKYTPNNYYEFTNIEYGTSRHFPDSVKAFEAAIKQLEKACYRRLQDTILYYSDNDNVASLLQDDDNRLYTSDGKFYCSAFELTHGYI